MTQDTVFLLLSPVIVILTAVFMFHFINNGMRGR